jgi:DNA-binding LacI/PurR family transcriptional regulator
VVDDLLGRRVDGLIICAGAKDHMRGRTPEAMGVPAVLIGQQANSGFPIIKTHNLRAGREATEYLWRLGHRNFAYLTSHKSWHDFHDRGRGMLSFLRGQEEAYEVQVIEGLLGEADTYEWVRKASSDGLGATALLASTDRHALGALAALSDARRKVPQRVSVMGFDDYVTSGFVRPSLTTMQMPAAEMGRLAVNALHDRIQGKPVSMRTVLRATLIERASTAGQSR